ncbi:hypothetical protein AMECASPLE_015786 [Ameca splendens]|uniref:Uncharacterized protein n=1 Tax=Ameca splendens TaxID=208324 RepID=A0ABV0YD29_9TELE
MIQSSSLRICTKILTAETKSQIQKPQKKRLSCVLRCEKVPAGSCVAAPDMHIAKRIQRCGLRPGSCLFSSDLAADKTEPCGSIALKGSSCIMGFLYDADIEATPPFRLL